MPYFIPTENETPDFSQGATASSSPGSGHTLAGSQIAFEVWQQQQIVAAPPLSDWDGFNLAILSNTAFNTAYATTLANAPLIATSLPAALSQVAGGQTAMFVVGFNGLCAAAEVSAQQRGIWADIADGFNLPAVFVAAIRG